MSTRKISRAASTATRPRPTRANRRYARLACSPCATARCWSSRTRSTRPRYSASWSRCASRMSRSRCLTSSSLSMPEARPSELRDILASSTHARAVRRGYSLSLHERLEHRGDVLTIEPDAVEIGVRIVGLQIDRRGRWRVIRELRERDDARAEVSFQVGPDRLCCPTPKRTTEEDLRLVRQVHEHHRDPGLLELLDRSAIAGIGQKLLGRHPRHQAERGL